MSDMIIVGFPKSGNTWLARLMGDALHRPIRGTIEAKPIAAEGEERGDARGVVRQLHLTPASNDIDDRRYPGFIASPWAVNPKHYNGEHIIHIIRDPRDVALAISHYWEVNLDKVINEVMATGETPLWGTGWEQSVMAWRNSDVPHVETRYERLHADTLKEVTRLTNLFALKPVNDLEEVIQRQSFEEVKKRIEIDGDSMTYGKGIQRKNMRKGIVGDWRETFSAEQKRAAFIVFGKMLIDLGYESSPLWWCSTQERNELTMMQMLDVLYKMTDTGTELCHTLYNLTDSVTGDIVELGAGRGRTAIALGWRTGNHVISVDDFADNADWANNIYGEDAKRDYLSNTRKAGVLSQLMLADSLTAAERYANPIGLWCWDISSRDRLLADWVAWRDKIRGRALIRDTFDESLGSREVVKYEANLGEFEIERDDPGILILRRIP